MRDFKPFSRWGASAAGVNETHLVFGLEKKKQDKDSWSLGKKFSESVAFKKQASHFWEILEKQPSHFWEISC